MLKVHHFAGILLFSLFCINCSTIVSYKRFYPEPIKPIELVSIITHPDPYSQTMIISKVNGQDSPFLGVLELMPGTHTLCAGFISGTSASEGCSMLNFSVEAGRIYVINRTEDKGTMTWAPILNDVTTELACGKNDELLEKLNSILSRNRPSGQLPHLQCNESKE